MKTAAAVLALVALLSTSPARAGDCPPGYANNGATCFRGADTQKNGGSAAADCPSGYTNTGLTCLRPAHSSGNGGSRVADCPQGFRNMVLTCYRAFPPKSLSESAMRCGPGEFVSAGRCFKSCPAGYSNTGTTCYRGPDTLGLTAMSCPAGKFFSAGRCYEECPVGYTNTGVSCFRPASTLPNGSDITWNAPAAVASLPVYNIAHMVNTDEAIDWAVGLGANGLEMDIHFDKTSGTPLEFRHGGACDCTCQPAPSADHVCAHLRDAAGKVSSCEAKSAAAAHLRHIATKRSVALVYMDSKVDKDNLSSDVQKKAGAQIVQYLEKYLFANGYQGIAVISAPASTYLDYLTAAAAQARTSPHQGRFFFQVDMDNGGKSGATTTLGKLATVGATNLAYTSGITSCAPSTYYSETSAGVAAQAAGKTKMTGIWSVDLESTMSLYAGMGARGLCTNRPGVLAKVLREKSLQLVTASAR